MPIFEAGSLPKFCPRLPMAQSPRKKSLDYSVTSPQLHRFPEYIPLDGVRFGLFSRDLSF